MSNRRTAWVRRLADLPVVDRGSNVGTVVVVGPEQGAERFISGVTTLPPGQAIRVHMHNCDEQVTILSGQARAIIQEREHLLGAFDTTFIPSGTWHAFGNAGSEPLVILWIYAATKVTRTFADSGETIEHLSSSDLAQRS